MRLVPDCNVLVSAARIDGTCRTVVGRVPLRHEIVASERIPFEHEEVAERPSQAPYRKIMEFVIEEIERFAVFVEPENVVFGLRDPDDEIYPATATAGGAILITGNTRDFAETRYGPVEVRSPRTFLDRTTWGAGSRRRRCHTFGSAGTSGSSSRRNSGRSAAPAR